MAGWRGPKTATLIWILSLHGVIALSQAAPSFNDLVEQASAAREQNDVPRAIELYTRALKVNPKWSQGWWFLGSLQYGANSFAAACDSLTEFIALAPNPAPAFSLRGLSEFETGEYAKALADIQQSIALGEVDRPPNGQRLRFYEGVLLTRVGRFDEAFKAYQSLVQRGTPAAEVLIGLGLAGLRLMLIPKDISENEQELVAGAGEAVYRFMIGDEKGGSKDFENLFQHFPVATNLHCLYGALLFNSDPDLALGQFKRELEIAPSNQRAQVLVAWSLLMRNNAEEALAYAKSAVGLAPEIAAGQLVLGRSLVELGSVQDGVEHLQHALPLDPDNLEIHIALAKAYSRLGRKQDAERERSLSLRLAQNGMTRLALP